MRSLVVASIAMSQGTGTRILPHGSSTSGTVPAERKVFLVLVVWDALGTIVVRVVEFVPEPALAGGAPPSMLTGTGIRQRTPTLNSVTGTTERILV